MRFSTTGLSRRLAADTKGGVAVIVALSLPVIMGFGALGIEYGSALTTRSENQRTSDIAAFAAAHAYSRDPSAIEEAKRETATIAAISIASLNGVSSSGVNVSFGDAADEGTIDVTISEDKPIYLSRLLRQNDSVTINTLSRVALGQSSTFTPCILALGEFQNGDEFTVNGGAGDYNLKDCGIGSNAGIDVNGQQLNTICAAPTIKKPGETCDEEMEQGGFPDMIAELELTNWPNDSDNPFEREVCDSIGTFPDDFIVTDEETGKETLEQGVLCVEEVTNNFDPVDSDLDGSGNTLIFKQNVHFKLSGNDSFTIKPPTSGDFAGVGFYAPSSDFTLSGNTSLTIEGLSCFGIVANSMTFNGNITMNGECDKEKSQFANILKSGSPKLIR